MPPRRRLGPRATREDRSAACPSAAAQARPASPRDRPAQGHATYGEGILAGGFGPSASLRPVATFERKNRPSFLLKRIQGTAVRRTGLGPFWIFGAPRSKTTAFVLSLKSST